MEIDGKEMSNHGALVLALPIGFLDLPEAIMSRLIDNDRRCDFRRISHDLAHNPNSPHPNDGLRFIGEVACADPTDILKIAGIGKTKRQHIDAALRIRGLRLGTRIILPEGEPSLRAFLTKHEPYAQTAESENFLRFDGPCTGVEHSFKEAQEILKNVVVHLRDPKFKRALNALMRKFDEPSI